MAGGFGNHQDSEYTLEAVEDRLPVRTLPQSPISQLYCDQTVLRYARHSLGDSQGDSMQSDLGDCLGHCLRHFQGRYGGASGCSELFGDGTASILLLWAALRFHQCSSLHQASGVMAALQYAALRYPINLYHLISQHVITVILFSARAAPFASTRYDDVWAFTNVLAV